MKKILITGGAGFIGSVFVRQALKKEYRVIVCDKLTYAGDLTRLEDLKGTYVFYKVDICNKNKLEQIFKKENPDVIVHFAAETHVDRSIENATPFVRTNILGTQILLDISIEHKINKFIHISTDEVYGEIKKGNFTEKSPLRPSSPYAASKAAADLLVRAYMRTYNFPAIIVRPCNNYGPWQYPEKFIPLAITKILKNEKIPIYGNGKNKREWLFVEDCANGVLNILENGKLSETYNLGSGEEKNNIEVVKLLLKIFHKNNDMFEFVKDRPGHDIRYSLNSDKIHSNLRWSSSLNFKEHLTLTISWYMIHKNWLLEKIK